MIGRNDLLEHPCKECAGTGKDPKKRTSPCCQCDGSGTIEICPDCKGVWRKDCKEVCFDQTGCMMPVRGGKQ